MLRVYAMRFCPFSERVQLLLAAKQIPHHTIYIDLIDKPEWYKEYSPLGKVPALQLTKEKDQPALVESLIIASYLDEKYPQPRCFPQIRCKRLWTRYLSNVLRMWSVLCTP